MDNRKTVYLKRGSIYLFQWSITMLASFESLALIRGNLVVSCQAWPGDPLDDIDVLRRMAQSAVLNGAAGLRLHSADQIAIIRRDTSVPIIGIEKRYCKGQMRITPDFASAARLADAGASIIALDCTGRTWQFGEPWRQIVDRIHGELDLPVMADIATLNEGLAAAEAGADLIGMTLNGYTEETKHVQSFNWRLLDELVQQTGKPVIAEGRIATPSDAGRAIERGAWSVVVGSAITRPGAITESFVRALHPTKSESPAIGVDIGGTSVKAGLVNRQGAVSFTERIPTIASQGRDAIASAAAEAIQRVLAHARKEGITPIGLGIASAGAIDADTGSVFAATDNLPGWAGFQLRAFAEERFKLPVRVNNDAHAAVLAELHFGLGRHLSDFIALTLGTGLGGGIVSGGQLIRGQHGFAGSVGHHTIRIDGRACNCGRKGCLEAYVSTAALIHEYQLQPHAKPLGPHAEQSAIAQQISQLALAGDPAAQAAYSAVASYLAEGVANLFNLFDPQAVILSGGLIEGHTQFAPEIEARVTSLLHFGALRKPRVQLSSSGVFAGISGAAASIFEAEAQGTL
jgi:glucokinase-like ROK family protein